MNCTWPSAKVAAAGVKLCDSLSFRLFITLEQLRSRAAKPSTVPSFDDPSKLNGPSLSTQPIPWSLIRAEYRIGRR